MRILLLIALLYIFIACKKETKEEFYNANINEIDAVLLLNNDSNALNLILRTRELQGEGFIEGEVNTSNNIYSFYLHNLKLAKEGGPLDTMSYPRFNYQFPSLQSGEYPITINIDSRAQEKGKLIVSPRRFEVKMDSFSTIGFPLGNILEY